MYVLLNMWFQTLIRQFFFNIDKIIFGLIARMYDLLLVIARTSPLSQADISDIAGRVYKLLAIFMIFKVTFSLIMYVVNPDDFTEKGKGIQKLTVNVVLSLALLILTPYFFNYAYQFQKIILEDNSLAALIFGTAKDEAGVASTGNFFSNAGEDMAYIAMGPFFVPDTSITTLYSCTTLMVDGKMNEECSGLDSETYQPISGAQDTLYNLTQNPSSKKNSENEYFKLSTLQDYVAGIDNKSLGLVFRQDMALATDSNNEVFIMDYSYIGSTAVGVCVVLLLITYCMDIAVRSIKLAFLQLIAPIPIISYIDPKSGKDGLFKKWYKMCFSTYISLFVRLLIIYFCVYIISRVGSGKLVDIVDGSYVTGMWLSVFILIGALMFAKQFPKILEGLGIKLDGGGKFTLNPLKKFEDEALGGKAMTKVAKAPLKLAKNTAKGIGMGALVGGAAFLTGRGFRGVGSAIKGGIHGEKFGKNFSNSYKAAHDRKKQVQEMKADGVKPGEVWRRDFINRFSGRTILEKQEKNISRMDNIVKGYDQIKSTSIAIDGRAKAQDKLIKGIESAGSTAFKDGINAKLSDGTTITGKGKTAAQIYQEVLEGENAILDKRIKGLANGTITWDNSNADAVANAKETVINTTRSMQSELDALKKEEPGIRISDVMDSSGNILDVKATGKGAQGAKDAYVTSHAHDKDVAKYTKNNGGKK